MGEILTQVIVIDYETVEILADGSMRGSTEAYRDNFRVDSCAFSWFDDGKIVSEFIKGEDAVKARLLTLGDRPVVAHNIQFEILVTRCRFPDVTLNWHADTMRLVQVYDNGGDKFAFTKIESLEDMLDKQLGDLTDVEGTGDASETHGANGKKRLAKPESTAGLGLVKAVKRLLDKEFHDHKREAHDWIRSNVPECKSGRIGGFLNRLPDDILERYNIGDTENTLRLYDKIVREFDELAYDWRFDHSLYFRSVNEIVNAKIRGVRIDREQLSSYVGNVTEEIAQIAKDFRQKFEKEIEKVERQKILEAIRKRKTLRGRKKYVKRLREDEEKYREDVLFNIGSNKQLEMLFVHAMGMKAKFVTAKNNPSFRSAVLSQWGDGGNLLKKRRKRLLVLKQSEALLELSKIDGRWHLSLRAAGTSTGRFAGGSH
jgi:hypothetical protein